MEVKAGVKAGGLRKSMPTVYRVRSRGDDTDSEGEEDSPNFRKGGEVRWVRGREVVNERSLRIAGELVEALFFDDGRESPLVLGD